MRLEGRARRFIAAARGFIGTGIRRGGREAQIRRLRWQVDREKAALGETMYPLLNSGQVQTDLPEVREHMMRIEALVQRLEELQTCSVPATRDRVSQDDEAEARWTDEGGGNTA